MNEKTIHHLKKIQNGIFLLNALMFLLIGYLHFFNPSIKEGWVTYLLFLISLLSIAFNLAFKLNTRTEKSEN